jgi:hypothetical protein
MTKDDKLAMETHGITSESKDVYHFKNYTYDRLADAVRYAKFDTERRRLKGGVS